VTHLHGPVCGLRRNRCAHLLAATRAAAAVGSCAARTGGGCRQALKLFLHHITVQIANYNKVMAERDGGARNTKSQELSTHPVQSGLWGFAGKWCPMGSQQALARA